MDRFADHDFALAGGEPAAFYQLQFRLAVAVFLFLTQLNSGRHQAAHGDVHIARAIFARKNDDHDPLTGGERLTLRIGRDPGQGLERGEKIRVEASGKLGGRAFAHDQNVERVAARHEGFVESGKQGHQKNRRGHGERDAERGHDGEALAQFKIANVVTDGDGHEVISPVFSVN